MNKPTTATAPQHRRINETLLEYWNAVRGDRAYPSEGEIDPGAIDDIWDACFLVKLSSKQTTGHYQYTYLGSYLIEAYGDDITDQEVCRQLFNPDDLPMMRQFQEVERTGAPLNVEDEFTNLHNVIIKYRSCMLPLGEPGGPVDYVLGGMKWKMA